MNMLNHYKAIFSASAEVVGMSLAHMDKAASSGADKEWLETYMDNVNKMLLSIQATQPDQFIVCVHRMQMHYKPIADR